MWDDLVRKLARYPSVVLTVVGADGYPYSVRCVPVPDASRKVFRMMLPGYVAAQAGPAGLLGHFHDDALWNQTNVVASGTLEPDGEAWVFRATRHIEGAGAGMSAFRQLRGGRAAAQRYLDRRGLPWPQIPWAKLHAIYARARSSGRG